MLFLTLAAEIYKESFLESVTEFHAEGKQLYYELPKIANDFAGFVQSLRDQEDPHKLRPGWVPSTEYWLIEGNKFIGRMGLRHELNDSLLKVGGHIGYEIRPSKRRQGYGKEILRLGLAKAQARGLHHVLVTCDEDNIGSKKIIEANGGVLENALVLPDSPVRKLRYWIDLA